MKLTPHLERMQRDLIAAFDLLGLKTTPEVFIHDEYVVVGRISITLEERDINIGKQHLLKKEKIVWGFVVEASTGVPGQATLSNGDPGWPDDIDVNELFWTPQIINTVPVVQKVLNRWMQDKLEAVVCNSVN